LGKDSLYFGPDLREKRQLPDHRKGKEGGRSRAEKALNRLGMSKRGIRAPSEEAWERTRASFLGERREKESRMESVLTSKGINSPREEWR